MSDSKITTTRRADCFCNCTETFCAACPNDCECDCVMQCICGKFKDCKCDEVSNISPCFGISIILIIIIMIIGYPLFKWIWSEPTGFKVFILIPLLIFILASVGIATHRCLELTGGLDIE